MRRINYRHIICIIISLGFVACGVMFLGSFARVIESIRDFGLSLAYYFCEIYEIPCNITPTVITLPHNYSWIPATPFSFDVFQVKCIMYWSLLRDWNNFLQYLKYIPNVLVIISYLILPIIIAVILSKMFLSSYLNKITVGKVVESRSLQRFKKISDRIYRPIKIWLIEFGLFIRDHDYYWKIWLFLGLLYFNVITIGLEIFAYIFYVVASFDLTSVILQIYKLIIDLAVLFEFLPFWTWVIVIIIGLSIFARNQAYKHLSYRERRNQKFLSSCGIVSTITGPMGVGKTTLMTDMALTYEVKMLYDALEIILETDVHFPNFPWANFERNLKYAIRARVIYDKWSAIEYVRKKRMKFENDKCRERIYDYDYEHYGMEYDNKLYLTDIWEAMEDYAQAYLIYTVQSSYIVSNYSIRSDKLIDDLGNFPLWNTDFFKRDSRLIDSFSRHSHILDFDMLRLGKKMLRDNPNRNAFGFGIYVITEGDKERKNTPELSETKRNVEECNQKNDLFNSCVKMSRHACVVANRVFVYILLDLQRSGSINADFLELGNLIEIKSVSDNLPLLPFYSPFWFLDLFSSFLKGKWDEFYLSVKHVRTDSTLFIYFLKHLLMPLFRHKERMYNMYGSQRMILNIESGKKDTVIKEDVWFRQSKKIYSKRFKTDCISSVFEQKGKLNVIGIDDLREYADIMANNDERLMQHSHFQKEIEVFSGNIE